MATNSLAPSTIVAMSGNDTLTFNSGAYSFVGFADGNIIELTFPNELVSLKTGKNGNSIYGLNTQGLNGELKMRLVRYSADDVYVSGLLSSQLADFTSFVLINGVFTKTIGDGNGNLLTDQYVLSGGVITKIPEAKSNVEGDTEQSVVIYSVKFAQIYRALS